MKINIISIGKLKEKFLREGAAEYLKRLRPFVKVEIVEIPECKTVDEEAEKILSRVSKNSKLFVLDVFGEELTSENFAKKIADLTLTGESDFTFAIGGAFGLGEELRKAADFKLSLSKMTFTHQMTRIILLEQIYRAFKINRGEPYHW